MTTRANMIFKTSNKPNNIDVIFMAKTLSSDIKNTLADFFQIYS
jgi:hypothetical protein